MDIRRFDPKGDIRAAERIWYEVGWIENPEQASYLKDFLATGSCIVGCLRGTPECVVHTVPGTIRYVDEDLKLSAVTAVTTSRIARKQGFARHMTARQLAEAAEQGAEVAALGMFEQGFYDQVGFGTVAYEHQFRFDPATLLVDRPFRVPSRLHRDEWQDVHAALTNRLKHHGACSLDPPELLKGEMAWHENGFGLGYWEGDTLTHFIRGEARGEYGPYEISYMAYRSVDELLELFALIKSLGDQVSAVVMLEPAHVQLQTLLKQPFRNRRNTRRTEFENDHRTAAFWQVRILDLPACIARRRWHGEPVEFNLNLIDPVEEFLSNDGWQGIGGEYTVSIGAPSAARAGATPGLPVLSTTVNTFSRLFFGVASATDLQASDGMEVPESLLEPLDAAFCLPHMKTSWEF
ncbi:MAG: GNAT family N-acetyltransferase [Gammaproteobacteria bacterium]